MKLPNIVDSEPNLVGRFIFTLCLCASIWFFHSHICISLYSATAPAIITLILSSVIFWIALLAVGLLGMGLCAIVAGFGWIFAGGCFEDLFSDLFDAAMNFVMFVFYFIFGSWDRLFFLRKQ